MSLTSVGFLMTCSGKKKSCQKFWCQYEVGELMASTTTEVGVWKLHHLWYEKFRGFFCNNIQI